MLKQIKLKIICALITIISTSLIVGISNATTVSNFNKKVSYTKEKWTAIENEYKYYMAESFLEKVDIIGLTKSELITYLGSDYTEVFDGDKYIMLYNLFNPVRKNSIDPYYLSIQFLGATISTYSIEEH